MKTNFLLLVAFALTLINCENTDYYPDEMVFDPDVSTTRIDEGGTVTFTDYSAGVVSRTWTFNGGLPAVSTDKVVDVMFAETGQFTCTIESKFSDGITETKEFQIIVGTSIIIYEGYTDNDIFSFEDETKSMEVWGKWENDGAADVSVDATQGANGTSKSAMVSFTKAGEVQLFTNEAPPNVNASMDKTKTYEYSFWAKASVNTTITAALENSSAVQNFHNYLWRDQAISTEWTKYTFAIDPSGQPYDIASNVYIKLKMQPSNSSTVIWFDEFSLKEIVKIEGFGDADIFSFEDETKSMDVWGKWENDGAAGVSVDATQGANGTSKSAMVSFTKAGEVQLFTNEAPPNVNASMDKTKTYEYSFWAKASENTTITAALENSSATQNFHNYLWQDQGISTEWTKYTFNINPSGQPYDIASNVYIKIKMQPSNSATVIWFDEFSLKEK